VANPCGRDPARFMQQSQTSGCHVPSAALVLKTRDDPAMKNPHLPHDFFLLLLILRTVSVLIMKLATQSLL
jgi:hypothetical protein